MNEKVDYRNREKMVRKLPREAEDERETSIVNNS